MLGLKLLNGIMGGLLIYVAQAIFLNKLSEQVEGHGSTMGWLPIFNVYLLGKLTFNKLVGWLLVICVFLQFEVITGTNENNLKFTGILPENISDTFSNVYGIVVSILYVYAIYRYIKLKKEKK